MDAKLTLTKPAESWGEPERRTHVQQSVLLAETYGDGIKLTVQQGACNSGYDPQYSTPESAAALTLTREQRRVLAAFLSSLPDDDADA